MHAAGEMNVHRVVFLDATPHMRLVSDSPLVGIKKHHVWPASRAAAVELQAKSGSGSKSSKSNHAKTQKSLFLYVIKV